MNSVAFNNWGKSQQKVSSTILDSKAHLKSIHTSLDFPYCEQFYFTVLYNFKIKSVANEIYENLSGN